MRWSRVFLFWRARQLREAEQALSDSLAQRPEVERLVRDVRSEGARNNFAPRIARALRGDL